MLPQRKHIRFRQHDYSGGLYFITACTHNKVLFFGEINQGEMNHSPIGAKLSDILLKMNNPDEEYIVWKFCIMPNHFHALIEINNSNLKSDGNVTKTTIGTKRTRLSVFIGELKAKITQFAKSNGYRDFKWQPKYYDRIVRSVYECNMISEYIENNQYRWENDELYSPIGLIHR